jgi:ABC-2 type transport system permease protein
VSDDAIKEYKDINPAATDKVTAKDLPISLMLKELKYEDDSPMLKLFYEDKDKAKKNLKSKKVKGIITVNGINDIILDISENGLTQDILANIISIYKSNTSIIEEKITSMIESGNLKVSDEKNTSMIETGNLKVSDEKNTSMIESGNSEVSEEIFTPDTEYTEYVTNKALMGDNNDPYLIYFYNLIAMVCIMGSLSVLDCVCSAHSSESYEGMRICVSPVNNIIMNLSIFAACLTFHIAVTLITLIYLIFGLGINFGGNLGYIFLTAVLGTLLGCSLGFFIAGIHGLKLKTRNSILMWIMLGGGFLSGLMFANMKSIIEEKMPLINRINPSAVLTDAFYSINLYGIGDRFMRAIYYLVILTVLLLSASIILSRKKEGGVYASV